MTLNGYAVDESYWDANLVRAYVHNSDLQRRWAMAFLAPNLKQLKGDEKILDIGCGDGKISADVSKFVSEGFVLGLDPSLFMLDWAKKQYCFHEYPNLTFKEGGLEIPNLSETFDVIYSTCAVQHCLNQPLAFENLASLLKKGGKLWIMVPSMDNDAWKLARKKVQVSPKWACYWQNQTPRQFLNPDDYVKLLEDAHLRPIRVERIQTIDPFVDREDFLTFLLGTFIPAVPLEHRVEFWQEFIDEYLRALPEAIQANGVIEARFGRIEIEAIK